MNKVTVTVLTVLIFVGCSHAPKCPEPKYLNTIYFPDASCRARIREVIVGSQLPKAQDSSASDTVLANPIWVPPHLENSDIVPGHYVLKKQPIEVRHE